MKMIKTVKKFLQQEFNKAAIDRFGEENGMNLEAQRSYFDMVNRLDNTAVCTGDHQNCKFKELCSKGEKPQYPVSNPVKLRDLQFTKKYNALGITVVVTDEKLQIEVPLKNLVNGFNLSCNNYNETTIKDDKIEEFVDYTAKALIDNYGPNIGDSPVMIMLDSVFEQICEGCEDFAKYKDEEEETKFLAKE